MEKQENDKNVIKRLAALAGVLIMAGLVLTLIFLLITGGSERAVLAVLFCLMVVPCIFYIILRYVKLTGGK